MTLSSLELYTPLKEVTFLSFAQLKVQDKHYKTSFSLESKIRFYEALQVVEFMVG
jgi:hypothetical protein